jgi:YndJ-like protein
MIGALVWAAVCLVPLDPNFGIGTIEKLFLLAPLVVVPLGLQLIGAPGGYVLPAAMIVVASFFMQRGWLGAALTGPWAVVALLAGVDGLRRLMAGAWREPARLCEATALLMLPAGALGLVQSRWGLEPLGYREPVVLLVGVHFHYAAFVSPLMASRVVGRNWPVALAASAGSPVLALGYILFVPWVRFVGAMLLVAGLVTTAAMTVLKLRGVRPQMARMLVAVSSLSVVVAMAYAGVYALADFCGVVWIAIPQMARTHGMINALGFSVAGLLGWTLAERKGQRVPRRMDERTLHSLRT